MAQFKSVNENLIFEVTAFDTPDSITQALSNFRYETMRANSPYICVEYPVYLKEEDTFTHIGYVQFLCDINERESRCVPVLRHFTTDRQELDLNWNPFNFYKGKYGFKTGRSR